MHHVRPLSRNGGIEDKTTEILAGVARTDPAVGALRHHYRTRGATLHAQIAGGDLPRDFRQPGARYLVLECAVAAGLDTHRRRQRRRSEEHTSELQSLMRISYAVFCLNKKKRPTS